MSVIMQAFYWNAPRHEEKEFAWWNYIREQVPHLHDVGFTSLWLPPVSKGCGTASMGYDPYDYFDLGEYDNRGWPRSTWFGSRTELEALIAAAHDHNLSIYADVVFNHNSGADAAEINPIDERERWTIFNPKSKRFPRNWECFHPSPYEIWDNGTFEGMTDLCHRNPYVFGQIMEFAKWMVEEIGFDGFRYDLVKGYGAWLITAVQEYRYSRGDTPYSFRVYGVGEFWDGNQQIRHWLNAANHMSDNPVKAFDFALRYRLADLCDSYGYSLRTLMSGDTLLADAPELAVTFVENHDVHRPEEPGCHRPIINDKMLAYAFILTHPADACVFWLDYYSYGLGLPGEPSGIAALVRANHDFAGGPATTLHLDDDLYIMQREGTASQPGLVFVLNNRGDGWNGTTVTTRWPQKTFRPVAWRGRNDTGRPENKTTDTDGKAEFWAPPRGYVVYVPEE
jgi:alpha-amylase